MNIHVTDVGRKIAASGLLPQTANDILVYFSKKGQNLAVLLADKTNAASNRNAFDFAVLFACLSSPEFVGIGATRFLHYSLGDLASDTMVEAHAGLLKESPWQPYRSSANAAALLLDWINGAQLRDLEGRFRAFRAGKIQAMAREAAWCLSGFVEILAAATKQDLTTQERPIALQNASCDVLSSLRQILPALRLLTWRLSVGFPAEILWMSELKDDNGHAVINRAEAVALYQAGLYSYSSLRQRNNWKDMIDTLRNAGVCDAQARAQEIQKQAHAWHAVLRHKIIGELIAQLPDVEDRIREFFDRRDTLFQDAFESLLDIAGIRFTLFDNGNRPGAFDYLIHIDGRKDLIVECKTKQGNSLVDMGEAKAVLSAALQYGYNDNFCITLCNPGINPDIIASFADCSCLSIVEAHTMATALIRIATGKLPPDGFYDWIAQPGLSSIENLFAYARHIEGSSTTESIENKNVKENFFA